MALIKLCKALPSRRSASSLPSATLNKVLRSRCTHPIRLQQFQMKAAWSGSCSDCTIVDAMSEQPRGQDRLGSRDTRYMRAFLTTSTGTATSKHGLWNTARDLVTKVPWRSAYNIATGPFYHETSLNARCGVVCNDTCATFHARSIRPISTYESRHAD